MTNEPVTLNDLATVVKLIDICSKRGAFEGRELVSVGQLRDRIEAYLVENSKPAEDGDSMEKDTTEG